MKNPVFLIFLLMVAATVGALAQEVPINEASVDASGRIQIQVTSSSENYYVLYARHDLQGNEWPVSMTLGEDS